MSINKIYFSGEINDLKKLEIFWKYSVTQEGWDCKDDLKFKKYDDLKLDFCGFNIQLSIIVN